MIEGIKMLTYISFTILFFTILLVFIVVSKMNKVIGLLIGIAEKMGVDTRKEEDKITSMKDELCAYYLQNKNDYTIDQFVKSFNDGRMAISLHERTGDITVDILKSWLDEFNGR